MRKYKNQHRVIKEKVLLDVSCDLCGYKAKDHNWNSSSYTINETEIKITMYQKDGESYPEGGCGTEYNVDICPKCFKDKLIPWLESQGCKAKIIEWDY